MTFERGVALVAVLVIQVAVYFLAFYKAWGLWPVSWGWWAACAVASVTLSAVVAKLMEDTKTCKRHP